MDKKQLYATDLKVNDMMNPIGVEREKVLFSWIVTGEGRGNVQSAYRIIVSSSEQLLGQDNGDIWDSGKVNSSESTFIYYKGCELGSNRRYWWKVSLWDGDGSEGAESEASFFDTGLDAEDWKARWIWKSNDIKENSFAYFRREVKLDGGIAHAKVFASAHNNFKLYVNGSRVGGHISPAPTEPTKSKYYLSYDITELIGAGSNILCAVAHYIGGNGQNYVNGFPGFILQCEITDQMGNKSIIITNEDWKVLVDTPYADGTAFQQNRRISAIERFDSNIEPYGWLVTGFDDSSWSNSVISHIEKEKWMMKPQNIPEGVIEELIDPKAMSIQEAGLQVFDAGKIISGWPVLELKGIKNAVIRMRYSENLNENGRVGHNVTNETSENYYDEYIMSGEENQCWSPDLSYKAFRYVEFTGYPELLKPENVRIASAHTGVLCSGSFNSSNALFNDIYKACIQTQKNNMLGQLVDCPHREQAQYLADSDLHAETFSYYFESHNMLVKVLEDFKDAQLEDGTFPFVFPANFMHPDFYIMIPEWDLHFCTLMWKIYFTFGDKSVLSRNYGTVKKMLQHYLDSRDESLGLIPKCKDRWHISDWPYPNIVHEGDFLTVQNIKIYHAATILARIAGILEIGDDESFFGQYAEELKNSIVKHLYDVQRKVFIDSYGTQESHQGTNIVAYQYGLVPENDRETILEHIVGEGLETKTLLSLNLFQVLFENGREEDAYRMLNNTQYPGWGHMIDKGYKTIWEGFDDIESHSHAWNAYPARLFIEYIVGIKAASPGFSEIIVKPFMPIGMSFAEGSITTSKGNIYCKWEKKGAGFTLVIDIPSNTTAKVYMHKNDIGSLMLSETNKVIWKNGIFEKSCDEIDLFEETGTSLIFRVKSGKYCFKTGILSC